MRNESFRVEVVSFGRAEEAIRRVRETVFVEEQKVPLELEWDGIDADCDHVVAWDEADRAIGTARLTPDDHIGRVAVLATWRGRGVGAAMVERLIALAGEQGRGELELAAQTDAIRFYERFGFVAEGDTFMDAGIEHRRMVLRR